MISIVNKVDNRRLGCAISFQSIADSDAHFFYKNLQEDIIMAQIVRTNIVTSQKPGEGSASTQ